MKLNFPEYAIKCLNKLEEASFEAYFVGGCVRDGLLNRICDDIDIATNAHPDDVMSLFNHTIPTGLKHGTVTVVIDGHNIEITTYRTEGSYKDCRHPENVKFVSDINDDLSRRDFTVNALAYNPKRGIIDLFGGMNDLESKIIRAVGNPDLRFNEDSLRILRAYRFASVLNFELDKDVISAAKKQAHLIKNISGERILQEISKLAKGSNLSVVFDLFNSGIFECFGIKKVKVSKDMLNNIAYSNAEDFLKPVLFLSLMNHNIDEIKLKLKPDSKLLKQLAFLDSIEKVIPPQNETELKLMLFSYGKELVKLYILYLQLQNNNTYQRLLSYFDNIINSDEPYSVSQLSISGNDLKGLGFTGDKVGIILKALTNEVIYCPAKNNREYLLNLAKKLNHH